MPNHALEKPLGLLLATDGTSQIIRVRGGVGMKFQLIKIILVNIRIRVYLNLNIRTLCVIILSFIYLYFYLRAN
jgi:hypothetical protein